MYSEKLLTGTPSTPESRHCRRLLFTGPGRVEVVEERLPRLRPGEVYARTVLSGISHGTEMAWLGGEATALHRTWDADRRIYLDGPGRNFPVAPGYETVAVVTEIAPGVRTVHVGDLVYLDRPHADVHVVDAATARAGRAGNQVSAERVVFWPLARVALGAVHDAAIHLGETVVVVGLGTVGLLALQFARHAGAAKVIGVDRHQLRLRTASSLGAEAIDATKDVGAEVRRITGPTGADAAIEASGTYRGLHEAIRSCGVGGRVATVASYHGEQRGLRLGEEYHRNRVTLISSMTVNGCTHRLYPAWDLERLNHVARDMVSTKLLRVDGLITHRMPFARAAEAYVLIRDRPQDTIKVVLTYDN